MIQPKITLAHVVRTLGELEQERLRDIRARRAVRTWSAIAIALRVVHGRAGLWRDTPEQERCTRAVQRHLRELERARILDVKRSAHYVREPYGARCSFRMWDGYGWRDSMEQPTGGS